MARAIWDETFKAIGDQSRRSKECIREKLTQVTALRMALNAEANPCVPEGITKNLEECLLFCLRKFDPAQPMTGEKYDQYYKYAVNAAMGIDEILSQNCSGLEY